MKIILEIFRYILSALLALSIFVIFMCNIAMSTVLSEGYVVSKVSQTNYYKKIYEDFNQNFLKYIMQSGFDESIINNVCSIEKVEQDTVYIIENIYYGKNNEIETESIKNNLQININNYLNEQNLFVENDGAVDEFINIICDEYLNTIFHTKYESKAYDYITKIQNWVGKINQYGKYFVIGIIILIFLLDIKRPSRNISIAGMSLLLLGLILYYLKYLLLKNVDIDNLFILSEAFSDVLKFVLNENLENIIGKYKIFISVGLILIILGNILQVDNKKKKHRSRSRLYLPEVK